ncbi:preQ0 transporter [Cutibacterium acnes JCM 18916]|nr:preQ0 transporter [Cutibacterium acnes JCM 18916]
MFPLAYVMGDITTEIYGIKAARRAIVMGFICAILSVLCFWAIIALPGFTDTYSVAHDTALKKWPSVRYGRWCSPEHADFWPDSLQTRSSWFDSRPSG